MDMALHEDGASCVLFVYSIFPWIGENERKCPTLYNIYIASMAICVQG